MATLAVYRGEQLLRKVELGETPMRIGRAPENEIVLEDTNKGVSRMHAEIRYEDGRYVILDLNSQNGVWIQERRVRVDPIPVDVPVTVGPYRLVLLPEPSPSAATSIPGTVVSSLPGEPTARVPTVEATGTTPQGSTQPSSPQPGSKTQRGSQTQPAGKTHPPGPSRSAKTLVIAGLAVAVLAVAGVFALLNRRPSPVPPIGTTPAVTSVTTTVPPSEPTPEARFQDHYGKAQGFIEKGDRAAATAENTQALAVLPSDPRGLKQRADIEAMITPPAPTPVPVPPAGPGTNGPKPPPPVSTLTVAPRPGESASERNSREKNARYHLDDGRKALEERRYAEAIDLLQRALETSERPDYGATAGEAASLLKSARTGKANADAIVARDRAQKLVDQAKALASSDLVNAVKRLREALTLDSKAPGANELMTALQDQLVAQGEAALISAKNFDRAKRTTDAIRDYDRAIQLLELVTGGHKELAFAKQRSADLKTPR